MKSISLFVLASLLLVLTACHGGETTNTSTTGMAKIACDESFRNILDQEIEVFEYAIMMKSFFIILYILF